MMTNKTESDQKMFDIEDTGDANILEPFDPTMVRVEPRQYTVDSIYKRIKYNEINLKPEFQRFEDIWTPAAQSKLIESLLIRIPIPAFYVDASDEDEWQVIDGLQRMTVFKKFLVEKKMVLSGLEFLDELENKNFDELHRKFQRRIMETQLTVYAIQPGTPNNVKFNIFKRVNTGGLPLTAQEIRHAIYQGNATTLLKQISTNTSYRNSPGAINDKRMADRELILRYFTYLRLNPYGFKRETLDKRLNDTMQWLNDKKKNEIKKLHDDFFQVLDCIIDIFGKYAFRKPDARSSKRLPPINKPLFETWMVILTNLKVSERKKLINASTKVNGGFDKLIKDEGFIFTLYQSTSTPDSIKGRFEKIQAVIDKVLDK